MRYFALLATIFAATLGTSYEHARSTTKPQSAPSPNSSGRTRPYAHGLVDAKYRTPVEVAASAYDEDNCPPNGCIPENTRDGSLANNSRWSCKEDLLDSSDDDEGCWIEYYFKEPQDIVEIRVSFYKGDSRTRTLDVFDNGSYHSEIESSGETSGYETFYLDTDETAKLKLKFDAPSSKTWLSIKEVLLMVK